MTDVCRTAGAVVVLMSLALSARWVHAQDTQASSLQKEVEELRREVKSLQEQVKTLKTEPPPAPPAQTQTQPAPANPAKPATDSIVALRESWSHVEKGMTQAEITGLLGAPSRELTIDGKLVWYYYYAGIGGSSVFFNGDGRVSSKQRPTVGWW
jgi:SmpA/OmlA family protein